MPTALRKVLLCLVMFALPLHGIAGIAMVPLQRAGHGGPQARAVAAQATVMHADAMAAHAMADCADLLPDCAHLLHAKGAPKCNLSSPCGLVAAPALHLPTFEAETGTFTPMARASHERIAFCTGAPERPPRLRG